jgi:Holliday junction resolvase
LPNKHYLRGRRLEWEVKKDLEAEGWQVFRTAGSRGEYDLIAIRDRCIRFIQCKSVDTEKSAKKYTKSFTVNPFPDLLIPIQQMIVKIKGNSKYTIYPLERV